jgi:hypothetical protein
LTEFPARPVKVNTILEVRSLTEDKANGVSHVELYAVQLPTGTDELLIRADAPSFEQTAFTAFQQFIVTQPGHYAVKVVGYNKLGQKATSDLIGFDAE